MSEKKERMQVSWKLDYLSEDERKKVNDWLDQQANTQKSIANVVLHMVDRFGNTDVMGHEIQRLLFTETTAPEVKTVEANTPIEVQAIPPQSDKKEDDSDDWFENIDENNL